MLEALEGLPPVQALRASFIAYPLVNAAHIAAIGALLTTVLLLDVRTLGGLRAQPEVPFIGLMRRVALGSFAVAVLTGVALFSIRTRDYLENPAFIAKMVLLLLAGLNFVILARRGRGEARSVRMRVAAVLSMLLWPAVLVGGRFIGFVL